MKKYMQITLVLVAFFTFVWLKNMKDNGEQVVVGNPTTQPNQNTNSQPTQTTSGQASSATVASSKYKDGTYTGTVADAYYGNMQVQAVITNGKITDINFLQYPNDNGTSRRINDQSNQFLKSEALQAQSANVDTVSGASDSSQAFRESLASALQHAQ